MKNIKPSELVALGLHDLETVEKMKDRYEVDMATWHSRRNDKCCVCMAGAVMAVSLKHPIESYGLPESFDDDQEKLLHALNSFRCGDIRMGLSFMKIKVPEGCQICFDIPGYEANPVNFKSAIKRMITYLETQGL